MKRIALIDALRGFALFLILIFHAYGNFGVFYESENNFPGIDMLDNLVIRFMYLFVVDKAFAIFSIMFGFSFFIQMDRSALKNEQFSMLFARRLLILLVIGYLNALIYRGDILTKYAVIGFILLGLSRFNSKVLIGLATLLLLNIPGIVSVFQNLNPASVQTVMENGESAWGEVSRVYTEGSLFDVIAINLWVVFSEIWLHNLKSGRIMFIIGYFIIGLLIGRSRLFEKVNEKTPQLRAVLFVSAGAYILIRLIRFSLEKSLDYPDQAMVMISDLLNGYMSIFTAFFMFAGFILLYQHTGLRNLFSYLAPYGRMGLTTYVMQGIIGVVLFYGFGFGLFRWGTPFFSVLVGIAIFFLQLVFSHFWFKKYAYGPLEWVWRSLTFPGKKIPLKKTIEK